MQSSEIPLRKQYPIQKRKIFKRSFLSMSKALIGSAILVGITFFLIWLSVGGDEEKFIDRIGLFHEPILVVGGILLVWIVWYPIYQFLYFTSYYYDMNEYNLFIRKGVTSKREITIPLSKITDVYLEQDTFDIFLGLYDLYFSTPTTESLKFAHISGLNKKGARKIKSMILDHIHKTTPSPEDTTGQDSNKKVTIIPKN